MLSKCLLLCCAQEPSHHEFLGSLVSIYTQLIKSQSNGYKYEIKMHGIKKGNQSHIICRGCTMNRCAFLCAGEVACYCDFVAYV